RTPVPVCFWIGPPIDRNQGIYISLPLGIHIFLPNGAGHLIGLPRKLFHNPWETEFPWAVHRYNWKGLRSPDNWPSLSGRQYWFQKEFPLLPLRPVCP